MKSFLQVAVVVALFFSLSNSASSKGKISLGVGADVVIPVSDAFKALYKTGFGGTARGQYEVNEMFSVMLTAGFISMPVDAPSGVNIDNGSMIPVVAGGKVFFLPGNFRPYGALDIGITSFKQSVTVPGLGTVSATSTEFTWQPQLGFESNLGRGNTKLDVGVRYVGISDAGSFAARVAVLFGLGN